LTREIARVSGDLYLENSYFVLLVQNTKFAPRWSRPRAVVYGARPWPWT